MKKVLVGIAALIVATPLMANAQTSPPPARPADRPASDRDISKPRDAARDTRPAWKHEAGVYDSGDVVGTRIKNAEGKDIGEIDRLMIDRSGKVSHVVVGLGGFLGVGERKVVVPWSDLKFAAAQDGKKAMITMDQAKLESAPRYERAASAERSPSASPATTTNPRVKDSDKDGKRDSADKAPADPTKK